MLQDNTQTAPVQVDLIAIDTLFKRIAERGRKIRIQKRISEGENLNNENLLVKDTSALNKEKAEELRRK